MDKNDWDWFILQIFIHKKGEIKYEKINNDDVFRAILHERLYDKK